MSDRITIIVDHVMPHGPTNTHFQIFRGEGSGLVAHHPRLGFQSDESFGRQLLESVGESLAKLVAGNHKFVSTDRFTFEEGFQAVVVHRKLSLNDYGESTIRVEFDVLETGRRRVELPEQFYDRAVEALKKVEGA